MKWTKRCKEFVAIREMIENEDYTEILKGLLNICNKYAEEKWDYAEDFEDLAFEIEEIVEDDELEEDTVDWYLDEFYDLCNIARVWLEID